MTGKMMLVACAAAVGVTAPAAAQRTAAPATASAMSHPDVVTVRNITRVELIPGLPIVDDSGTLIGEVERRAGNMIVISDGKQRYKIPITQLYAFRRGAADHFASRLPKAVLEPVR